MKKRRFLRLIFIFLVTVAFFMGYQISHASLLGGLELHDLIAKSDLIADVWKRY